MSDLKRELLALIKGSSKRNARIFKRQYLRVNVAHTLQRMRANASLTQRELAERAGMSQPEVSRLERAGGARAPELTTLVRFAEVCGYELKLVAERRVGRKREKPFSTQLVPPEL
jgi:transcriptional regulator with XRE-family HTH domain